MDAPLIASHRHRLAALAALTAVLLYFLAAGLPADGFFAGDSGLKLIAALDAARHPARPFELDLPRVDGRAVPLVDSMVVVHADHAHALQSPIFPVLSAPFVTAFGLRGAYLLPALGFLLMLPLLDGIRRRALPDVSFGVLAWLAIAASPLVFYALEFWEHAPAVAVVAAATALAVGDGGDRGATARVFSSGVLMAFATLLRPEAVWYAMALGLTTPVRRWVAYAAGAALVLVPFATANFVHMGDPLGPHASAVLAPVVRDFLAGRWARVHAWLWPDSPLETGALLLILLAWVFRMAPDVRLRQLLALSGAAIVAVLAARNQLRGDSLWQAFPVALLAFVPAGPVSATVRRLWLLVLVSIGGTVLTASHDGGAQWGARYLLIAVPPLMLLAARGATTASGPGRWRLMRIGVIAVILVAGAMTSRNAYLDMRGAKRRSASIVSATAGLTPPGGTIITNVWWFDQLTASLHETRTIVAALDHGSAATVLAQLQGARTPVTLVWSTDEGESLESAVQGTCYRITGVDPIEERGLRFASATCAP